MSPIRASGVALLTAGLFTASCVQPGSQFFGTWSTTDGSRELALRPDGAYRSVIYYEAKPSGVIQLLLDTTTGHWKVQKVADGFEMCITVDDRITCSPARVSSVDTVRQLDIGDIWYRPGSGPAAAVLADVPDSSVLAIRLVAHALRSLIVPMEAAFAERLTYPRSLAAAGIDPASVPHGVTVRITAADFAGWAATATFSGTDVRCEVGAGTRALPYGDEGEPVCRSSIHDRLAVLVR